MRHLNQPPRGEDNHHEILDRVRVYAQDETPPTIAGMSRVTELNGVHYNDIVNVLGEPTYPHPSGDEKVQKEWTMLYTDEDGNEVLFYLYDYKTFSEWETTQYLTDWSVGGLRDHSSVLNEIMEAMKQVMKNADHETA